MITGNVLRVDLTKKNVPKIGPVELVTISMHADLLPQSHFETVDEHRAPH